MGTDDIACKNRNASTPVCGPAGRCVGCMSNSDCTDLRSPVCSSNKSCGPCQRTGDCLSGICSADGSCAPTGSVLYVSNKSSCSATPRGSKDDPFCTIKDAVDAAIATNKSFISVEATGTAYGPVVINSAGASGLRIVGSGAATGVPIRSTGTDAAIRVESTGATRIKVALSGFDLASAAGNAAECNGNVDLSVESSRLHDSWEGILVAGCKLTIDGARVYLNRRNGISLTNVSDYNIQNAMIWRNDVSGIALSGSSGVLRFLTIYANGTPAGDRSPGIDCGSGNNPVEHSLVFSNISGLSGTLTDLQMVGCMATDVLTNDMRNGTYRQTPPEFITSSGSDASRFDLRLRTDSSTNGECCIDKVPQGSYINHDIDGNTRPQGAGYDVGAHEAK